MPLMKQRFLPPSIRCLVEVRNRQKDLLFTTPVETVKQVVQTVLTIESQEADAVSIHFLSEKAMCRYHKQYFDDPTPTDCMSFPIDERAEKGKFRHLGDVFVCPMTALRYAYKIFARHQDQSLGSIEELFWKEMALYIIHGVLHLLGYDDSTASSRSLMRRHERRALSILRKQRILLSGNITERRSL